MRWGLRAARICPARATPTTGHEPCRCWSRRWPSIGRANALPTPCALPDERDREPPALLACAALRADSRPAGGMFDAGERVQSEPLREGAHELVTAFEFDGVTAERRAQAEISHPHGGQRLRVAPNGDVDAEPGIAQTQFRVGVYQ